MKRDKHFPVMMSSCFLCGKTKNEILIGTSATDKEMPNEVCINHIPCDSCLKQHSLGVKDEDFVLILEVEKGTVEGTKDPAITGNYVTMGVLDFEANFGKRPNRISVYCDGLTFKKITDAVIKFNTGDKHE